MAKRNRHLDFLRNCHEVGDYREEIIEHLKTCIKCQVPVTYFNGLNDILESTKKYHESLVAGPECLKLYEVLEVAFRGKVTVREKIINHVDSCVFCKRGILEIRAIAFVWAVQENNVKKDIFWEEK